MRLMLSLVGLLVVVAIVMVLAKQQLTGLGRVGGASQAGAAGTAAGERPPATPGVTPAQQAAQDVERTLQEAAQARASAADR